MTKDKGKNVKDTNLQVAANSLPVSNMIIGESSKSSRSETGKANSQAENKVTVARNSEFSRDNNEHIVHSLNQMSTLGTILPQLPITSVITENVYVVLVEDTDATSVSILDTTKSIKDRDKGKLGDTEEGEINVVALEVQLSESDRNPRNALLEQKQLVISSP